MNLLNRARCTACFLVLATVVMGCASSKTGEYTSAKTDPLPKLDMELSYSAEDSEIATIIQSHLGQGHRAIDEYFELPFRSHFTMRILPSRAAFTEFFNEEWGIPETQCWWVAAGISTDLVMLSPRVWGTEACEHNPDDAAHIKGIVKHELVHVFHNQYNEKLIEYEDIGWFSEGLAVFVSGQLDEGHLAEPREAIETGQVPQRLANAWSGKYRYGISGTLVQYIDATYGRDIVRRLLSAKSQDELLGVLGLSEDELLERWSEFVLTAGS